MNRIISALAAILILSGVAIAQTAMRTTTLALPVGVNDRSISLASLTGVTGLSQGQVSTILFVDKEVMYVQSVVGSSANVTRGQNGSDSTAHNAGATVYVGPPGAYGGRDLSGACNASSWPVTPYININNGNIYTCTSNNWVLQGSGGGSITLGFGLIDVAGAVSVDTGAIAPTATLQTGAPFYCRSTTGNDTYTCTTNPAVSSTSLTRGQYVFLDADTANTGAATLAIGGGTARDIVTSGGATPANSDIPANRGVLLYWNGTNFGIVGGSSGATVSGGYLQISGTNYLTVMAAPFAATLPPTSGWTGRNALGTLTTSGIGGFIKYAAATSNTIHIPAIAMGTARTLVGVLTNASQTAADGCFVGVQRPAGSGMMNTLFAGLNGSGTVSQWFGNFLFDSGLNYGAGTGASLVIPESSVAIRIQLTGGNVVTSFWSGGEWVQHSSRTQTAVLGGTVANTDQFIFGSDKQTSVCYLKSWLVS